MNKNIEDINLRWCFAIINNKIGEIYFNKETKEIISHAYIDLEKDQYDNKTKKMIAEDTKKYVFSYKNKKYTDKSSV